MRRNWEEGEGQMRKILCVALITLFSLTATVQAQEAAPAEQSSSGWQYVAIGVGVLAGILIIDALTVGAMTPFVVVVGTEIVAPVAEVPAAMELAGNGVAAGGL